MAPGFVMPSSRAAKPAIANEICDQDRGELSGLARRAVGKLDLHKCQRQSAARRECRHPRLSPGSIIRTIGGWRIKSLVAKRVVGGRATDAPQRCTFHHLAHR